jgi:hypothetical protein
MNARRNLVAGVSMSLFLGVVSCAEVDAPESERNAEGQFAAVYEFEGRFNIETGESEIAVSQRDDDSPGVEKASYCQVLAVQDGLAGSGPVDTIELLTPAGTVLQDEACFGGAYPSTNLLSYLQSRAACGDVQVRSFFDTETLTNLYAELVEVTPIDGHNGYQYPLGTGAERPAGANAPLNARGLWSYGDIGPVGSPTDDVTRTWIFQRLTDAPEVTFRGRIVAYFTEDCATPIDDDCDGLINEGCVLASVGDPCNDDLQCQSGICDVTNRCAATLCTSGAREGAETDVDCGGPCSPCANGLVCAVNADCASGACGSDALCLPARRPLAGEVIVSEVMPVGAGANATSGEYVELYNTTGSSLYLGGCTLSDAGVDLYTLPSTANLTDFILPANGYATLGRSATNNEGLTHAAVYGGSFVLADTGDTVRLSCPGTGLVNAIAYTGQDVAAGAAYQLHSGSMTAAGTQSAGNFCLATGVFGGTSRGTPGTANASCDLGPVWCRLQFPGYTKTVPASGAITYYGRVYVDGVTSQSLANAYAPRLTGQVGYGALGTAPSAGGWVWTSALPNPEWVPFASSGENYANEINNDEYVASLVAPNAAGQSFDVAWRFSGDNGTTWTYCDRNVGTGADGSENGYQTANAARISVVPSVSRVAAVGEVVITEYMAQPDGANSSGEWFEVTNTAATARDLQGCEIFQSNGNTWPIDEAVVVAPGGYAVLARNQDNLLTFGLPQIDFRYQGIALRSTTETFGIRCDVAGTQTTIDSVTYTGGVVDGRSNQLLRTLSNAVANDDSANFCATPAGATFGSFGKVGSPGSANPDCVRLDFCRLQSPGTTTTTAGTLLTAFARFYSLGLTNLSGTNNASSFVAVQFGYGPDGSNPATDVAWVWSAASANGTYGPGSPSYNASDDEYTGSFTVPAASPLPAQRDYAFRFSNDRGNTWGLYCDQIVGGSDGSADGYQAANAGQLTIQAPLTVGYCKLRTTSITNTLAGTSVSAEGEVYVDTLTTQAGNATFANLEGQIGYGPAASNPALDDTGWNWAGASPTGNTGNNDIYTRTFNMPSAIEASYRMVARFRVDAGTWLYCDVGGVVPGSDNFDVAQSGTITPRDVGIGWGNIQWPDTNQTFSTTTSIQYFMRTYIAGFTEAVGQNTLQDFRAQFGYGPVGQNPASNGTGWTWVAAPFFGPSGSDDEFRTNFTIGTTGTYSIAARYSTNAGRTWTYRFNQAGSEAGPALTITIN